MEVETSVPAMIAGAEVFVWIWMGDAGLESAGEDALLSWGRGRALGKPKRVNLMGSTSPRNPYSAAIQCCDS